MSKDEIKQRLETCGNMVELVREANNLKAQGENETDVNKVVMELRKAMLSQVSTVKRIPRINVPDYDGKPLGTIAVSLEHLQKPFIKYDGEVITM